MKTMFLLTALLVASGTATAGDGSNSAATKPANLAAIWTAWADKIDGGAAVVAPAGTWQQSRHQESELIPLASVTKLMTAQVAMQLIAEKRFTLTTPAREIVPWLPAWTKAVTVEQLLTHTSGVQNMDACFGKDRQGAAKIYFSKSAALKPVKQRILRCIGKKASAVAGAKYGYNNLDFLILQAIIEATERQDFEAVLKKRVFEPAGMKSATLASWGSIGKDVVKSYSGVGSSQKPELRFNLAMYGGAGSALATFADVVAWVKWSLKAEVQVSPLLAGARYGDFQGYGVYAFRTDLINGTELAVVERPGAIAHYQWQISMVPDKSLAAIAYRVNDGAALGSLFEKKGLIVELLQSASTGSK